MVQSDQNCFQAEVPLCFTPVMTMCIVFQCSRTLLFCSIEALTRWQPAIRQDENEGHEHLCCDLLDVESPPAPPCPKDATSDRSYTDLARVLFVVIGPGPDRYGFDDGHVNSVLAE